MRASFRQGAPADTDADTLCFGLFEGDEAPADLDRGARRPVARLIESGEAKGAFKKVAVLHPDGAIGAARRSPSGSASGRVHARARARRGRGRPRARARCRRRAGRLGRPEGADEAARAPRWPRGAARRLPVRPLQVRRRRRLQGSGAGRDRRRARTSRPRSARSDVVVEHQNTARDLQNLPRTTSPHGGWPSTRSPRARRSTASRARPSGPTRSSGARWAGCSPSRRARTRSRASSCCATTAGRRPAARAGRQGGHLRHRRDLDQALGEDAGDEDGHVGRVRGDRGDRRDRPARLPVRLLSVCPSTENMPSGHSDEARRHHPDLERQDGRGEQHRRRGPADPGRRPRLRRVRGRRADRRPRDAHRRDPGRARVHLRGPVLQRRRPERRDRAGGERTGELLAAAAAPRLQGPHARQGRRPRERGRGPQGLLRVRGLVPRGVRGRQAVGPSRHRRHRLGPGQPGLRRQGRQRLGRAAAGRAGARPRQAPVEWTSTSAPSRS